MWNTSPNGKGNGIWGSGSGLAVDANGSAYVSTGNGDFTTTIPAPPPSTTIDYGDSIVRVSLANGIPIPVDYFTPYNQADLDNADTDVGSGGVLIPPTQGGPFPDILIEAGKQGSLYVINRDKMTNDGSHYCNGCTSDPEIIQTVTGSGGLWSMPSYWNGNVYTWGNGSNLKAFSLANGRLSVSATSQSAESSGFPGSTVAISSNGTTNGIVWAVQTDAYSSNGSAVLQAYDATDVATLLVLLEYHRRWQHPGTRREICRAGGNQRQGLRWRTIRSRCLRHNQSGQSSRRANLQPARRLLCRQHLRHAEYNDSQRQYLLHDRRHFAFHCIHCIHRHPNSSVRHHYFEGHCRRRGTDSEQRLDRGLCSCFADRASELQSRSRDLRVSANGRADR